MISIFKKFVLYFTIVSYTCALPATLKEQAQQEINDEKTTQQKTVPIPDLDQLVEQEMKRFKLLLDKITDNEVRIKLECDVENLIRNAHKHEMNEYKLLDKIQSLPSENKWLDEIKSLAMENGGLQMEMKKLKQSALKTFVVPYVCLNLELYEYAWDCGGQNSPNFNPDDFEGTEVKRHNLDEQTNSNIKIHAQTWDRIFQNSTHPSAIDFKVRIHTLYPNTSLQIIAKNIGLTYALLKNAKQGVVSYDPKLRALINPDNVVLALRSYGALKNPVLLEIVKTFEQVISGIKKDE